MNEKNELKKEMGIVDPILSERGTVEATPELWDLLIDAVIIAKILHNMPEDYHFTKLNKEVEFGGLYRIYKHVGNGNFNLISFGNDMLDVLIDAKKIWENTNDK